VRDGCYECGVKDGGFSSSGGGDDGSAFDVRRVSVAWGEEDRERWVQLRAVGEGSTT